MIQPFIASFTGTAVEFFETVAIAYALIRAGYAREAIVAVILGHMSIFVLAIFLAPFHELFPVFWMRLIAGLLLTAMGLHWARKSLKRIRTNQRPRWVEDPLGKVGISPANDNPTESNLGVFSIFAFIVMLKSSVIEASEILLVIFPIAAASKEWMQVIAGVATAIVLVSLCAVLLHGQLKKIPEVKLKLVIGMILTVLGIAWLVELYLDYN